MSKAPQKRAVLTPKKPAGRVSTPPKNDTSKTAQSAPFLSVQKENELLKAALAQIEVKLVEQEAAHKATLKAELAKQNVEHIAQLKLLMDQLTLSRQRMFGTSSETMGQLNLFNEAEATDTDAVDDDVEQEDLSHASKPVAKRRGKRAPLPAHLPRRIVIHEGTDAEKFCEHGLERKVISFEESEKLNVIPMQFEVIVHKRAIYGDCRSHEHTPTTAALPPQLLPKSFATPGLLATLIAAKFVDGVPLYRFEKIASRHGVDLSRNTMARWVIECGLAVTPIINLLQDHLLDYPVMYIDETVVQVLKEPDKLPQSQSYMWVRRGGPPDKPIVLFNYSPGRKGDFADELLEGYAGALMTDGYSGYTHLPLPYKDADGKIQVRNIVLLSCMAHVRRKFTNVIKTLGKKGRSPNAEAMVKLIAQLYAVESEFKDEPTADRYAARQARSLPALVKMRALLDDLKLKVPPKSALGTAVSYTDKLWARLVRYTENGEWPIDNNACERAIRPFVIGRKNWMFSDTVKGAESSASLYSLVETAKANGVEPYLWLNHLFTHLPEANTVDDFEKMLPWNFKSALLHTSIKPDTENVTVSHKV